MHLRQVSACGKVGWACTKACRLDCSRRSRIRPQFNCELGVHDHSMGTERRRALTQQELAVLTEVQAFWGPQNTVDEVFFSDADEAVLFVKAPDGSLPVCVVLTNLALMYSEGMVSLDELREQIMGPAAPGAQDGMRGQPSWFARVRWFAHRLWRRRRDA